MEKNVNFVSASIYWIIFHFQIVWFGLFVFECVVQCPTLVQWIESKQVTQKQCDNWTGPNKIRHL